MNPFLIPLLASAASTALWFILIRNQDPRDRRYTGAIGASFATLVLLALWQADSVPWLWLFLKAVLLVWFASFIILVVGLFFLPPRGSQLRLSLFFCASGAIAANLAGAALFLWEATVSPGGV